MCARALLRDRAIGVSLPAIEVRMSGTTIPSPLQESLNESYPAVPSTVPEARRAVAEFALAAGMEPEALHGLRLAVSEAVTNAVVHAYPDAAGEIHVTVALAEGELWVLIADDGCGMRPGSDHAGLGLGLGLIALLSLGLAIARRPSGGTELRMGFALRATAPPTHGANGYEPGSVGSLIAPASSHFSTTA
jgi:serine/threonine-protein kinase RsbW/stage II sporulation protein AB (anti-sigma F factor)